MRVSVKCNGYRGSVLAARDRDDALAAIFRPDCYRLLDALAWPRYFDRDCDRHSNRFCNARLCRVYAAIAGVPRLVVLPPKLAVIRRVPPAIIVVLPPMAFVVHRVMAVAARFKTGPALPAARPGHGSAGLGEKQDCYGSHRKWYPFIKLSFNNPHPGSRHGRKKAPTAAPSSRSDGENDPIQPALERNLPSVAPGSHHSWHGGLTHELILLRAPEVYRFFADVKNGSATLLFRS